MYELLKNKKKSISVTGLGYVGLPLALELAKIFRVVGFDSNLNKIKLLKNKKDPSNELSERDFDHTNILFSPDIQTLKNTHFHIIAVPTPIDKNKIPNLTALKTATEQIAGVLKKGDFVIYESTVFPGCTEEICLPILEKISGLNLNEDFHLGYSPERMNPGDIHHSLTKVVKIVSASNEWALSEIDKVYGIIIKAGTYKAASIKVAEAAKVIENTQRDLNIALVNELAIIFDKMGLDTQTVLNAAASKWNFLKYYPGLVGGHCIGVDPYYLTFKASQLGYTPRVILSGREINDYMPRFISEKIFSRLKEMEKPVDKTRILQLGITFKENVSDIRNSKAAELALLLKESGASLQVWDPVASWEEVEQNYQLSLEKPLNIQFDVLVIAVAHKQFKNKSLKFFRQLLSPGGLLIDIKGVVDELISQELNYWRL